MDKFHTHHPTAVGGKNHPRHRSFAAFGSYDTRCAIVGVLKKDGSIVARGKTLRHPPPWWVIHFQGAPPGGPFTLEITDAVTGKILDNIDGLMVPRNVPRLIGLTYPMTGDPIPPRLLGLRLLGRRPAGERHHRGRH